MMRFDKIPAFAALVLALSLTAGASTAAAQSLGFSHPGRLVTARGQVTAYLMIPGVVETVCDIEAYGVVTSDGASMIFDAYDGVQAVGDVGNLGCGEAVLLPIVVTPTAPDQITLDQFIVGSRAGTCQEIDYRLAYIGNTAVLPNAYFGHGARICRAHGGLAVTTDDDGSPVVVVAQP